MMATDQQPDSTDETVDLWGPLPEEDATKPAGTILKEQASLLTLKTGSKLRGVVGRKTEGSTIYHTFYIVAPSLQNYRYEVCTISTPILLYPVKVTSGPEPPNGEALKDEAEFVQWLQSVLNSADIRRVISSLLAQVRS